MKSRSQFLVLLATVVLLFSATSCGLLEPGTALTADGFREKMTDAGYEIMDATDQFEDGEVDTVLIAVAKDHQIEFYAMSSVAKAETAFAVNRTDFEALGGTGTSSTSRQGVNFDRYTKTTADGYYVVSRIESTFVFVSEEIEDKEAAQEALKLIGY